MADDLTEHGISPDGPSVPQERQTGRRGRLPRYVPVGPTATQGEAIAGPLPIPHARSPRAANPLLARPQPGRYAPLRSEEIHNPVRSSKRWNKPCIWAYGVTTVPERRYTTLPGTLSSLATAGFDRPRLFVDGDSDTTSWENEFSLPVTTRYPRVRAYANWCLALLELYLRTNNADYYALFQDDFVASKNLRQYLEGCEYPDRRSGVSKGYWNLYTFPVNQIHMAGRIGWERAKGWRGAGAVGLVFSRECLIDLMNHKHMVERVKDKERGHRYIDGAVVETMNMMGWVEYVHNPSPLQHTGLHSSIGNLKQPLATSFRGIEFDMLSLLQSPV